MIKTHDRHDIVIMGAGAAGALLAARLSKAGKSIVVLDAGPAWTLGDLTSSQIWSRRLKWGGAPVLPGGTHPVGYNFATGWGLGGAALHHYAGWPRLAIADFTMLSNHGRGLDWPIGYDDLRPHYDDIQAEVGISGDDKQEIWRAPGDPYPMPPLEIFAQGRILSAGFEKLGMHVSPAPMAVTSREFKGRPACLHDGWCDAGCPIGALANPLVVHLPAALKAGADVRAHAAVTRVLFDAKGKAEALAYTDKDGGEHIQPASVVILAGAAVQNARLLLASQARDPSGLTGCYFNAHSIANAHGLFDAETECHKGLSAGTLTCQDSYGKQRTDAPFGSITWGIAGSVKPNDLLGIAATRVDLFGAALHGFMKRAAKHIGIINGIVENVPDRGNRIELTEKRDQFGLPLARISHSVDANGVALWKHAADEGLRIVKAAGAAEHWASPQQIFAHVSGGTIMGRDPMTSVADSYGRLHTIANLFVAGGGLFPTIGAVSPTYTVLALANRTAAEILRS
jgi:choline dehydrogenase-like flavoprotein